MFSLLGFGFVRFGEQSEQMISLTTMQGRVGLGDRPMKVSIAYAKGKVLKSINVVIFQSYNKPKRPELILFYLLPLAL